MNKVILSIFVLLCATQAINGQFGFFGDLIGAIVGSVVNSIFGFVITVTVAIITFSVNTVVFLSQLSFQALANVNVNISRIVTRTNNTLFGLSNATLNLNWQIQNRSINVSSHSYFLGSFAVNSLSDSTVDLSYTLTASALALAGRRAPTPPARSRFFDDFFYINPVFSCIPDTNSTASSTNATIACQVSVFNYYANLQIANLNRTAQWYEKLNKYLNANCSTPNTTSIQNLTQQWSNLTAAINVYANVTVVNGTLFAYVNATLGANITNALNNTQNLIESFYNASACLVNASCSNSRRTLRDLFDWSDFSLISWWHTRFFRRQSYSTSISGLNVFVTNSGSLLSQLSSAVSNIRSSLAGYVNLKIQNYNTMGQNFISALASFLSNTNSSSLAISSAINLTINATEFAKSAFILNATAVVNSTLLNLTSIIISQNQTYPQCQSYLNITAGFFANFTTDVQTCGAIADSAHDAQYTNVTAILANLTAAFNFNTNATSSCYATFCAGNSASNSFSSAGVNCIQDSTFYATSGGVYFLGVWIVPPTYSISVKGQNFVNCYNAITSNVTLISNSILANVTAILSNLQNNVNNITVAYQNCIQAKANFAFDAFAQISANYTSCTQQTTTTVATTVASSSDSTTVSSTDSTTVSNTDSTSTVSSTDSTSTIPA